MDPRLEVELYIPADPFFGTPFLDLDEERASPIPYRHLHGGFAGTDTRFTCYFPTGPEYRGRLFHPLEGAHAGHEDAFAGPMGEILGGGLTVLARLGGYMVESNSGHIGDDVDPKGGDDPTLYGHRASIESARFSKHLAAQIYGEPPHHAYVWGGSGGARRSPLCLEYAGGVYDGAMPFMGGGNVEPHGTTSCVRSAQPVVFSAMFNVQRLLGDQLAGVVDATAPGGSGTPFDGLSAHQREELANLYRLGYPRGDEFMIAHPMGQMWLWTSISDMLQEDEDPEYFDAFWSQPGYVGYDEPAHVEKDLINLHTTVERVLTANDIINDPAFAGDQYASARTMALLMGMMGGQAALPMAVKLSGVERGYLLGTGVRITDGKAAGRSLYCMAHAGDVLFCDGRREANLQRFTDVVPGDAVHVCNRAFLAFCYYYRHHIAEDDALFDFLRSDGNPLYPQHGVPLQSPLMGVPYSGQYDGKLLWIHHTHDNSLWPPEGGVYKKAVEAVRGPEQAARQFRLRWTENAEHIPPFMLSSAPGRATTTWIVDYRPIIEQSLLDLVAWVEDGVEPAETSFELRDGKIILPERAAERGGIQPVVRATANGGVRAEVSTGEPVTLAMSAEVPPGAGQIVDVAWDLDGSGAFGLQVDGIDGTASTVHFETSHTYDAPGTYFATARVHSHRSGDVNATTCRIPNLAQVRIVVT